MKHIRVLIIEESTAMQQMLTQILSPGRGFEVVGIAEGGSSEAMEMLAHTKPDVVTMDSVLPQTDGFELTRRIMETNPLPIVIVSSSWKPDEVEMTFRAMSAGAVAGVVKPGNPFSPSYADDAERLVQTVKAMSEVKVVRRWATCRHPRRSTQSPPVPAIPDSVPPLKIVAIGASTGGPQALQTLLARLTRNFPVPVLIVQHIAAGFLEGLSDWLGKTTGFETRIPHAGEIVAAGNAYLAPDGFHMGVTPGGYIQLSVALTGESICPSVSRLFLSVSKSFGSSAAGVLLTGMGSDGVDGLVALKKAGAITIAQDRKSCVVDGMPSEAIRADAARYVLNPEGIADFLNSRVACR